MPSTTQLVAQILGFVGTVIVVIGMQQKKYKHIVICKIIVERAAGSRPYKRTNISNVGAATCRPSNVS